MHSQVKQLSAYKHFNSGLFNQNVRMENHTLKLYRKTNT